MGKKTCENCHVKNRCITSFWHMSRGSTGWTVETISLTLSAVKSGAFTLGIQ